MMEASCVFADSGALNRCDIGIETLDGCETRELRQIELIGFYGVSAEVPFEFAVPQKCVNRVL